MQRSMHTFRGMVSYCLENYDQPHFRKVEHNMNVDDVNEGIKLHSLYGADALKNKVCLTPANVFDRVLMFWRFKMKHPIGNGFLDTLQSDVQPRSDWFRARWQEAHWDNTTVTVVIDASACVQDNDETQALPDFQPDQIWRTRMKLEMYMRR
ncbi:hypothetical protein L7F22_033586 [Adiantum nelumboides]|nr:hypothetical protein [Adiantum nelumboides]